MADQFSFVPSDGALVISGTVAAGGSFTGTLVTAASRHDGQDRPGTESPPFTLTVAGHFDDRTATGTYATPRCHTSFRLLRIDATLRP